MGDSEVVGDGLEMVVGVGDAEAAGDNSGAGVELEGVGIGAAFLMTTPLSQTNFLPDLTQVYFFPE